MISGGWSFVIFWLVEFPISGSCLWILDSWFSGLVFWVWSLMTDGLIGFMIFGLFWQMVYLGLPQMIAIVSWQFLPIAEMVFGFVYGGQVRNEDWFWWNIFVFWWSGFMADSGFMIVVWFSGIYLICWFWFCSGSDTIIQFCIWYILAMRKCLITIWCLAMNYIWQCMVVPYLFPTCFPYFPIVCSLFVSYLLSLFSYFMQVSCFTV